MDCTKYAFQEKMNIVTHLFEFLSKSDCFMVRYNFFHTYPSSFHFPFLMLSFSTKSDYPDKLSV